MPYCIGQLLWGCALLEQLFHKGYPAPLCMQMLRVTHSTSCLWEETAISVHETQTNKQLIYVKEVLN